MGGGLGVGVSLGSGVALAGTKDAVVGIGDGVGGTGDGVGAKGVHVTGAVGIGTGCES